MQISTSSCRKLLVVKSLQDFIKLKRNNYFEAKKVFNIISKQASIGFVPTMGSLHKGHISLVNMARKQCDIVVTSIYVNKLQFLPHEDFNAYPRNLEKDVQMLSENCNTPTVVFAPDSLYADYKYKTIVEVEGIENNSLEAKARPSHFRGVATIVTKLFNIVEPDRVYFGQKDAIQCIVIKRLVRDLNMDIEVIIGDTIREEDGLAMSSRNTYLSNEDRKIANILYKSLCAAKDYYDKNIIKGPLNSDNIRKQALEILSSEKRVECEYISIANLMTGEEMEIVEKDALLSGAIRIGKTRLIDNLILAPPI